jgi:hypothetical protein
VDGFLSPQDNGGYYRYAAPCTFYGSPLPWDAQGEVYMDCLCFPLIVALHTIHNFNLVWTGQEEKEASLHARVHLHPSGTRGTSASGSTTSYHGGSTTLGRTPSWTRTPTFSTSRSTMIPHLTLWDSKILLMVHCLLVQYFNFRSETSLPPALKTGTELSTCLRRRTPW